MYSVSHFNIPYIRFASYMREKNTFTQSKQFEVIKVITPQKIHQQQRQKTSTNLRKIDDSMCVRTENEFTGEGKFVCCCCSCFFQFSNGKMKFNWNMMLNKRKRSPIEP